MNTATLHPLTTLGPAPIPLGRSCGLALLRQGYDYADHQKLDSWDFSQALATLLQAGLNENDLRLLLSAGHILQGRDESRQPGRPRRLRLLSGYRVWPDSCFVLTNAGASFWQEWHKTNAEPVAPAERVLPCWLVPRWLRGLRELRVAGQVVLRLDVRAENLLLLLGAFQVEGWPEIIDNPYPVKGTPSREERLDGAVRGLNAHQERTGIEFHNTEDKASWRFLQKN
jgi:hypothetical protein